MGELRIKVPNPEGEAIGCTNGPVCPACDETVGAAACGVCGLGQCPLCGSWFSWRLLPSGFGQLWVTCTIGKEK